MWCWMQLPLDTRRWQKSASLNRETPVDKSGPQISSSFVTKKWCLPKILIPLVPLLTFHYEFSPLFPDACVPKLNEQGTEPYEMCVTSTSIEECTSSSGAQSPKNLAVNTGEVWTLVFGLFLSFVFRPTCWSYSCSCPNSNMREKRIH